MSAREDLAALLFVTDNSKSVSPWSEWEHVKNEPRLVEYVYAMADALLAAGYRKPRTITTAERDRLLALHRASTDALEKLWSTDGDPREFYLADDAFRDYLFSLDVTA